MGPILGGVARVKYTAATANVVCDGNSLTQGQGGASYPSQLSALAPLSGLVSVTNVGISGQTTPDMINNAADVDGAWVAGKTNVLIVWEGSNSICNIHNSAAKAASDIGVYIAARQAVHPWRVILLTCLPRQTNSGQANTTAQSIELDNYNALLRVNYRALGAHVLVDIRATGSPFNMPDYNDATFESMAAANGLWSAGETGNHIHLSTAGYAVIAGMIVPALKRLPAR